MKKLTSFIIVFAVCLSFLSGCSVLDKTTLPDYTPPEPDKPYICDTQPVLDGSESNITDSLQTRLETENFVKAKNIILMIGDGMGFNSIRAAKCLRGLEESLAMELLPNKGCASTHSTVTVTDSAAAATALATGFKTDNGKIGILPDGSAVQSLLELAAQAGKKTGVIATKNVTDATPACFTAHTADRRLEEEAAKQQLGKLESGTLDLLLGGGNNVFNTEGTSDNLQNAKNGGVNYIVSPSELEDASLPLLGLFSGSYLPLGYKSSINLTELTQAALDKLKCDEGFFLMVEGSQIDTQNHINNATGMAEELVCFDGAVSIAMRFVAENPDTVLIVTADHETGGIVLPDGSFTAEDIKYTTAGHTDANVPVFAIGYGTEFFSRKIDNTDIPKFIAKQLGSTSFGRDSDMELIQKAKNRIALSAYNLDIDNITINDALSEYYGNAFVDDACVSTSYEKAEKLRDCLQTEINSKHDYLIFTQPISDDPQDCRYLNVTIYIPKNAKLSMNGKQLETVDGKYTGTLRFGEDFFDDYIEFTLYNSFATAVIRHTINIIYTAYDRFVDLTSEEVYTDFQNYSSNKFSQGTFTVESGVLNINFSSSFSRFIIPSTVFSTGVDISHYSNIRITVKNNSDSEKEVFPLHLSSGSSLLILSPSVTKLPAGQTAVVDYYLDKIQYGAAAYENVVSIRLISVYAASFAVSNIFIYNKK